MSVKINKDSLNYTNPQPIILFPINSLIINEKVYNSAYFHTINLSVTKLTKVIIQFSWCNIIKIITQHAHASFLVRILFLFEQYDRLALKICRLEQIKLIVLSLLRSPAPKNHYWVVEKVSRSVINSCPRQTPLNQRHNPISENKYHSFTVRL